MLMARGLPAGVPPESFNLELADVLEEIVADRRFSVAELEAIVRRRESTDAADSPAEN